jgi:thiamine transport system ATP-binding protein
MAVLEVRDLRFRYEDMRMAFDLRAERGEFLALIGPSGAGKSTLLSLIAGFERAEGGAIGIDGVDVTAMPPSERPVTMLFQDNNLFAHLTVAQNVGLGLDPGLRLSVEQREKVAQALERVGLRGFAQRRPDQLSGGERQRTALARSLARNRPLLLLDEPFAALGPALRREMIGLVNELRLTHGFTVLFVTHQPEDALHAGGRVAFIRDGHVAATGPARELLLHPTSPELLAYLGPDWLATPDS